MADDLPHEENAHAPKKNKRLRGEEKIAVRRHGTEGGIEY